MKIQAKYCVIGTGAGGGIIAYKLAQSGEDVLVLNTGNIPDPNIFENELTPEQKYNFGIGKNITFPIKGQADFSEELYAEVTEKSTTKIPPEIFQHFQIQHINGLQNLWNGTCLRYSEEDFANRHNYNENCRWQVSYKEMADHYSAVEKLALVVGSQDGLSQFPDGDFMPPKQLRDIDEIFLSSNKYLENPDLVFFNNRKAIDLREYSMQKCVSCGRCVRGCRSSSVYKFSTHLYPQIKQLKNFRLFEYARVIKVESEPGQKAKVMAIDERNNAAMEVYADVVVISAGAIESTRLLLNSFSLKYAGMDQVGKYLQDVPSVGLGTSLMKAWFKPISANRGYGDHVLVGGQLKAKDTKFPFVAQFCSDFMKDPIYLNDINFLPRHLKKIVAKQIYSSTAALILWAPSVPRKENCLELSNDLDRYGQRQLNVLYERDPLELVFNKQLEKLGRKLLRNASGFVANRFLSLPGKGIHYSGTCRMGATPNQGVVDKNLKFYGADNIYICDGGVIPQLSEKHLTLTIMALAHRLGEHLIRRYS